MHLETYQVEKENQLNLTRENTHLLRDLIGLKFYSQTKPHFLRLVIWVYFGNPDEERFLTKSHLSQAKEEIVPWNWINYLNFK